MNLFSTFFAKFRWVLFIQIVVILLFVCSGFLLGEEVFSPFSKFLAEKIFDVKLFLLFILIAVIAMSLFEFFVRQYIQHKLLIKETLQAKILSVILPAILFIALHLPFGKAGILYGGVIGLVLGVFYLYKNDWQILALWQTIWLLTLTPMLLFLCLVFDSQIRNDFLFAYKKKHIQKEMMYYRINWGWVDKIHYRQDHFDILLKSIEKVDESGEVTLEDGWRTPLGINVHYSEKFAFKKPANELDKWAMVSGMMLHFMTLNETTQEQSPWYHGNQLSAWQFDDMSSCLLCCLDNYPQGKIIPEQNIFEINKLLQIWQENGAGIVKSKTREKEAWQMLSKDKRIELMKLIDEQKVNWRVIDKDLDHK